MVFAWLETVSLKTHIILSSNKLYRHDKTKLIFLRKNKNPMASVLLFSFKPLNASPTKWPSTLKQLAGSS